MITTARLTLRPPVMHDAPDIAALVNDRDVTKWLTQLPYPYSEDDARDFIARQTSGRTFMILDHNGLVGCIGTVGEFGYWLGRAHWGQGYMTDASEAVLNWHFSTDGADLISGHALGNDRSRAVLLKMGFVDTDIVDRTHAITGDVRAQQVMSLTRTMWDARDALS